jgi:transcriptional regulator with XRE-family HTH domain
MNNVRELRKQKGIQQKELAIEIGVSNATVSDWEHGRKNPSGERLRKLAEFFDVEPMDILYTSGDNHEQHDLFVPEDPKTCGISETEQIVQHVLEKLNISGPQPQTEEAKIFVRGIDKLPQEERKQLLDMARVMFKNVFDQEDE